IPTSSTTITPSPTNLKKRASARGGSGPRTTSSLNPSPPTSSISPTKYAQRTRSSVRVGPDAPYASVGGGAATRTPNVQTPANVPVRRQRVPAHGVGAPRERAERHEHHVRVGAGPGDAREDRSVRAAHDDRVRERLHALVERHRDDSRRLLEPL